MKATMINPCELLTKTVLVNHTYIQEKKSYGYKITIYNREHVPLYTYSTEREQTDKNVYEAIKNLLNRREECL